MSFKILVSPILMFCLLSFHLEVFAEVTDAEIARLEQDASSLGYVNREVLKRIQDAEAKARGTGVERTPSEENLAAEFTLASVAEQVELCRDSKGGWKTGTVMLPGEKEPFECTQLASLEYEILRSQAGDNNPSGEHNALMCSTLNWHTQDRLSFARQLEQMGKLKHGLENSFECDGKKQTDCISDMACNILNSGMDVVGKTAEVFGLQFPRCPSTTQSSCLTEVIWGVWKDLVSNVEGLRDIAAMGWSAVKGIASKAWGWVSSWWSSSDPAEDATSIKQAFIENQPDSFFSKFITSPISTFREMVGNFMSSMKTYISDAIKDNFGCAEFESSRLASPINPPKCKTPVLSWDCATCSQKLNMVCGTVGFVGGEVLVSFITGGAIRGATAGAQLATRGLSAAAKSKIGLTASAAFKFTRADKMAAKIGRLAEGSVDLFKAGGNRVMAGFSTGSRVGMGILSKAGEYALVIGGKIYKAKPGLSEKLLKVLRGGKAALKGLAYPARKYLDVMEDAFALGVSGKAGVAQLRAARAAAKTESGIRASKVAGMGPEAVRKLDNLSKADDEIRAAQKQLIEAARNGKKSDEFKRAQQKLDEAYNNYRTAKRELTDQLNADEALKRQEIAQKREQQRLERQAKRDREIAEQKQREFEENNRRLEAQRENERKLREVQEQDQRRQDALEAKRRAELSQQESIQAREASLRAQREREALEARDSRQALLGDNVPDTPKLPASSTNNVDDIVDGTSVARIDPPPVIADDVVDGTGVARAEPPSGVVLRDETPRSATRGRGRSAANRGANVPREVTSIGAKDDLVEISTVATGTPVRGRIVESSPQGITIKQADGQMLSIPARNVDITKTRNLFETSNIPGLNIAKPGDQISFTLRNGKTYSGPIEVVNSKSVRVLEDGRPVTLRTRDIEIESIRVQRQGTDLGSQVYIAADRTTDIGQVNQATGNSVARVDDVVDVVPESSANLPVLYRGNESLPASQSRGTVVVSNVTDDVATRLGPYAMMDGKVVEVSAPGSASLKGAKLTRSERLADGSIVHHWALPNGASAKIEVTKNNLVLDMRELAKGRVRYIAESSEEVQKMISAGRVAELEMDRTSVVRIAKTDDGLPLLTNGNKSILAIEDLRKLDKEAEFIVPPDRARLKARVTGYVDDMVELILPNGRKLRFPIRQIGIALLIGKAEVVASLVATAIDSPESARALATDPTRPSTPPAVPTAAATPAAPGQSPPADNNRDTPIEQSKNNNTIRRLDYDPTKGGRPVQIPPALVIPPDMGFMKSGAW
ncbi:MAG: hypothetical protein Fur0010_08390 [Bdellovibrio sp.]